MDWWRNKVFRIVREEDGIGEKSTKILHIYRIVF